MIRSIIFAALIGAILCSTVEAQNRGFGLGIIVGEPTGISGKLWTGHGTAIDGAVAWSFKKESSMHLHGDFLLHGFRISEVEKGRLLPYYGIGGRIKFEEDSRAGVRVPLGLDYILANSALDIFFEIVPLLDLVPDTEFDLNAGLGIRYFF